MKFTIAQSTKIGKKLGVDFTVVPKRDWNYGMNVELEHADITGEDALMTGKIALAHIKEYPDYYIRLRKMESDAEKYWDKRIKPQVTNQ